MLLKEISELSHVGDARNKGLMAGVELVKVKIQKSLTHGKRKWDGRLHIMQWTTEFL